VVEWVVAHHFVTALVLLDERIGHVRHDGVGFTEEFKELGVEFEWFAFDFELHHEFNESLL